MQDETQMASATSSPDPLAVDGPDDRDIDVLAPLLEPDVGSVSGKGNRPDSVQVFPRFVALLDFVWNEYQGSQMRTPRATAKAGHLV
jgi:hypothetical protein